MTIRGFRIIPIRFRTLEPIYLITLGLTPFQVGVIATGTLLGSGVLTTLIGNYPSRGSSTR